VARQAFFSGTAKMCVRELRSTEAPNVIVFYLAIISTLGALTGVVVQVPSLHRCRLDV
jgi:hypothetical protein